jgi:hypothetical protein
MRFLEQTVVPICLFINGGGYVLMILYEAFQVECLFDDVVILRTVQIAKFETVCKELSEE